MRARLEDRRWAREMATVQAMIGIYCRHTHRTQGLCDSCRELWAYARTRIDACSHGTDKPTCRCCSIHCYDGAHRAAIRSVMWMAGPRMLFHHPLLALHHGLREWMCRRNRG